MNIHSIVFALLPGLVGLMLAVYVVKGFSKITKEHISFGHLIVISVFAGIAGTLIFFCVILVMGVFDETYYWTIAKLWGAILVSLIPGSTIMVGSFLQSLFVAGYKKGVIGIVKKKTNIN
jgi:hypothetical protein